LTTGVSFNSNALFNYNGYDGSSQYLKQHVETVFQFERKEKAAAAPLMVQK